VDWLVYPGEMVSPEATGERVQHAVPRLSGLHFFEDMETAASAGRRWDGNFRTTFLRKSNCSARQKSRNTTRTGSQTIWPRQTIRGFETTWQGSRIPTIQHLSFWSKVAAHDCLFRSS